MMGYNKTGYNKRDVYEAPSSHHIVIRPLDPLMIRDGRPFSDIPGIRAYTMSDLTPSVLAGSIKTMLHKTLQASSERTGRKVKTEEYQKLSSLIVRGPLYRWRGSLYFPRPYDIEFWQADHQQISKLVSESSEKDAKENQFEIKINKVQPFISKDEHSSKEEKDEENEVEQESDSLEGFFGIGKNGRLEDQLRLPRPLKSINVEAYKPVKETPAYVSEAWMKEWLLTSIEIDPETEADKIENERKYGLLVNKQLKYWNEWKNSKSAYLNDDNKESQDTVEVPAFMSAFPKEERTHIQINQQTQSAEDKHLFSTQYLVFPADLTIEANIAARDEASKQYLNEIAPLDELHPIGGKRRLAHFTTTTLITSLQDSTQSEVSFWDSPGQAFIDEVAREIVNEKSKCNKLRMVLATPAYFSKGWQPGWLNEELKSASELWGIPIKLQLRWACVPQWQAISGYAASASDPRHLLYVDDDRATRSNSNVFNNSWGREKSIRRMTPAGSAYFFEVVEGEEHVAELIEKMWLRSVSDRNLRTESHDAEDGFGLALWGKW